MKTPLATEPLDKSKCSTPQNVVVLPKDKFGNDSTPMFNGEEVNITECWGYWDGVLYGICEIRGMEFFFHDIIFDTWRHYDVMCPYSLPDRKYDQVVSRGMGIYGVSDVEPHIMREMHEKGSKRAEMEEYLREEEFEYIGFFHNYTETWREHG